MRALPDCVGHHFSRPLGRSPATTHMGRRVLRSTAPREQPETTENSPKTEFSTVWTNSDHCVEKRRKSFPLCGKIGLFFPQCGNIFSIVWKTFGATSPEKFAGRRSVWFIGSRRLPSGLLCCPSLARVASRVGIRRKTEPE